MKPIPQKQMDLAPGEPIPGSKYVRAYCRVCGAAMRVPRVAFLTNIYADCSDCERPLQIGHGTQNDTGEYDEHDGAWDNAVRTLEGAA